LVSASTTAFMRPRDSLTSSARATRLIGIFATRVVWSRWMASCARSDEPAIKPAGTKPPRCSPANLVSMPHPNPPRARVSPISPSPSLPRASYPPPRSKHLGPSSLHSWGCPSTPACSRPSGGN
jgi:hypothetical protein